MITVKKLKTYSKGIRRNARTGNTEVEALDPKKRNEMLELPIPTNGYILKPNEIYICEVSDPTSERFDERYFREDLAMLGINCRIMDDQCVITVQRSVKIYPEQGLFYEEDKRR